MPWAEAEEPVSLAKPSTLWISSCNRLSSVSTLVGVSTVVRNASASLVVSDLRYN